MESNNNKKIKKPRLFDIRHFPMDFARMLCMWLPLAFRIKKIFVSEKAKQKIKGGAIIAANHTCFKDPLLLGSLFWYRRMFFLAAEVVMENKIVGSLLKGVGCIKIDRNICDIESMRKTVSILKEGHVLALFPQGGINRDDEMKSIKSGIVLMAMQAKVPIIPVYVSRKTKTHKRNCMVIGEPIDAFGTGEIKGIKNINEYADLVFEKMTECRKIFEDMGRN